MSKLIITVGTPASGKSTVARLYAASHPNTLIIERDEIRTEIGGSRKFFDKEGLVTSIAHGRIRVALSSGFDVIVSDTNARPRVRAELARIAEDCGAEFVVWVMTTSLEQALALNAERDAEEAVPEDVIRKMWDQIKSNPPVNAIAVDINETRL